MNVPTGARLLALNESDSAYILDSVLHLIVGGLELATIPPGRTVDDSLTILERLRTLIDAAGDALASERDQARHF